MAGRLDTNLLERKIGREAANKLLTGLKSSINDTVNFRTFEAVRSTNVRAVSKDGRLQRLAISAPDYIFKQHYGFEGSKKNGISMRLKSTNVINKAIEASGALETLADDISELRGEQVITSIQL